MILGDCRLLSIVPYTVIPPTSGGQLSIVALGDAIGRICSNHILGTEGNGSANKYCFKLHPVFPSDYRRYIPRFGREMALVVAKKLRPTHIFCEHPYMAPLAISLSEKLNIPWVLRSQNIEAQRFRDLGKLWWPVFRQFERYAMRKADGIFFITPEDRDFARADYGLDPGRCHVAPFGTPLEGSPRGHEPAKTLVADRMGLNRSIPWLYFLGAHNYAPNAEAVAIILDEIFPRLQKAGFECEIIIAGKDLPESLKRRIAETEGRIRYFGFIEDLKLFIKACDLMMNPMVTGGGIKTKAIEALAFNKLVVSTENGAAGIERLVCGKNLVVGPDKNWDAFMSNIISLSSKHPEIPEAFYRHYNWDQIARKVVETLRSVGKH